MGCPSNIFYQTHAKYKHGGAAKALFCRNIMEACEAREDGSDSKQYHQVEGAIMQAKEWTRTFAGARGHEATWCAREKPSQEEERSKSPIQLFVRVL
jgi:hypothetical protein